MLDSAMERASTTNYGTFSLLVFAGEGAVMVDAQELRNAQRWAGMRPSTGIPVKDRTTFLSRFEVMVARANCALASKGSSKPISDLAKAAKQAGLALKEWAIPKPALDMMVVESAKAPEREGNEELVAEALVEEVAAEAKPEVAEEGRPLKRGEVRRRKDTPERGPAKPVVAEQQKREERKQEAPQAGVSFKPLRGGHFVGTGATAAVRVSTPVVESAPESEQASASEREAPRGDKVVDFAAWKRKRSA